MKKLLIATFLILFSSSVYAGMIDRLLDKAETQIGFMDYECYQTETNEKLLLYINYKEKYVTFDRGSKISFFEYSDDGVLHTHISNFSKFVTSTKKLTTFWDGVQYYVCKRDIF